MLNGAGSSRNNATGPDPQRVQKGLAGTTVEMHKAKLMRLEDITLKNSPRHSKHKKHFNIHFRL